MMDRNTKGCILFDWGDTLMRDFKEFSGPMKDWPKVETIPGAEEVLAALHPDWTLAVATNADVSDEADIRAALQRVGIDRWLDRIYCFKKIGHKKPSPEFYGYILNDLGLAPDRLIMVGDNYDADALGAVRCGLRGVWLAGKGSRPEADQSITIIEDLRSLPGILDSLVR